MPAMYLVENSPGDDSADISQRPHDLSIIMQGGIMCVSTHDSQLASLAGSFPDAEQADHVVPNVLIARAFGRELLERRRIPPGEVAAAIDRSGRELVRKV